MNYDGKNGGILQKCKKRHNSDLKAFKEKGEENSTSIKDAQI